MGTEWVSQGEQTFTYQLIKKPTTRLHFPFYFPFLINFLPLPCMEYEVLTPVQGSLVGQGTQSGPDITRQFFGMGVNRQAGKSGSTAHVPSNLFYPFQKHVE
jgi:hypothetical protein